jgi:CDP-diacylglycerol--glycerol-3-phosphate 3-phosphatidyltransferase
VKNQAWHFHARMLGLVSIMKGRHVTVEKESIEQPSEYNDQEWQINNLPNRLTMFRMILIPLIVGSLYLSLLDYFWIKDSLKNTLGWVAAWTFVVAAITDFFDGYIARKRKIVTVFGSFLDPMADKFLVVSSLILLQGMERIPVWVVIILVLREMYITGLRLLATERGFAIPVGEWGKWKTASQMVSIPLLMANGHVFGISMGLVGTILIYLASFFSLFSAGQYSIGLVRKIRSHKKGDSKNAN